MLQYVDETCEVDVEKNEVDVEKNEVDVEKNEINECVICLEPVTEVCEISKFGCIHSKNMHKKCVESLRKCPLCREVSLVPVSRTNNPVSRTNNDYKCHERICFFVVGVFFSVMVFVLLQPMIMISLYSGGYYRNETMYNETMYNETMYNDIMY
jgi:hypothetical protein